MDWFKGPVRSPIDLLKGWGWMWITLFGVVMLIVGLVIASELNAPPAPTYVKEPAK